ncbi:MAG: hypothetical protein M3277_13025 [Actinomycetota bacterium]|nr:hypothetical protein [Actinomycetota bacterium]
MAIYRPPKPRWRVGALGLVAGLAIGGGIGFAVGSPDAPDIEAAVAAIETSLVRAAGSLEIVAIEYAEAVEDEEVVARSEYEGALAAEASSEAEYRRVRAGLRTIVPDRVAVIDAGYEQLREAMTSRADEAEVARLAAELERSLKE